MSVNVRLVTFGQKKPASKRAAAPKDIVFDSMRDISNSHIAVVE